MTLGINLKKFRQEKKITQEELAFKLGKSKGVISNWEKGINRPDTDAIKEICKIFNVTPNELFDWDNIKDKISLNSSENELLKNFNKLNEDGKEEANKRIEELTQINKYINSTFLFENSTDHKIKLNQQLLIDIYNSLTDEFKEEVVAALIQASMECSKNQIKNTNGDKAYMAALRGGVKEISPELAKFIIENAVVD